MTRPPARRLARAGRLAAAVSCAVALIPGPAVGQVTFEGLVTDHGGVPQPDVDLDFFDAQSGRLVNPSAPGWEGQDDKTDFQGRYEMVVIPDVYHVRYEPPRSRPDLAPVMLRNVILGWDVVADVTLPRGARLEGRVADGAGSPVADVDLDFRDPLDGRRLVTVRDETGADGRYATTVIPGVWDVEFRPVVGRGVGPLVIDAFDLRENAALDVTLPRGWVLRGVAKRASGLAVPFADVDVDDPAARRRVPTADDDSDTAGAFAVAVPAGTFHVFVSPPEGIRVAPAARWNVAVAGHVDLGDIVMVEGVVFNGTALDPTGAPIAGGDLDLFRPGTCDRYPASPDTTDAAGRFALRVEPGTYDVVVRPAPGSALAPRRFEDVVVATSDPVELRMPAGAPPAAAISARVTDERGGAVAGAVVAGSPLDGGAAWEAVTGGDGAFTANVVPGRYALAIEPPPGSGLAARTLPAVDVPCGLAAAIALRADAPVPPVPSPRALRGVPNPWSTTAHVELDLARAEPDGVLAVFDVAGRRVRTLQRGGFPAGVTRVDWDGRDESGRAVASGIYFLRLSGASVGLTAKIARVQP